jgi:hypothetical protein
MAIQDAARSIQQARNLRWDQALALADVSAMGNRAAWENAP